MTAEVFGQARKFRVESAVSSLSFFSHRMQDAMTAVTTAQKAESRPDHGRARALAAARVADENRGTDVHVLDLRGLTDVFDYFVLATGTSRRQLHAMADEIELMMKEEMHDSHRGSEGYEEGRWIVLDYGDVVVHLFEAEAREYWDLEQLWSGCKTVALPAAASAAGTSR